jgi:hypothetical protein
MPTMNKPTTTIPSTTNTPANISPNTSQPLIRRLGYGAGGGGGGR